MLGWVENEQSFITSGPGYKSSHCFIMQSEFVLIVAKWALGSNEYPEHTFLWEIAETLNFLALLIL